MPGNAGLTRWTSEQTLGFPTNLLSLLEVAFVVAVFLLFEPGQLLDILRGREAGIAAQGAGSADVVQRAVRVGIYGIALLFLAWRSRRLIYWITRDKFLLLLMGLALFSVFWSFAPQVTVTRGFALLGTTLFGVYLAMRFSLEEQMRLLSWTLGVAMLLSVLVVFVLPTYGLMEGGEWQGIFRHKNALGRMMALGAIIFFLRAVGSRSYRWINYAACGLSIWLLLLSDSIGALATFLTLVVLLPLYYALRWSYTLAVPFFIVTVLAGGAVTLWLLSDAEFVLNAFGKETTLSGRTEIWDAVFDKIREQPWLGYGYSGFWLGWEGESAYVWLSVPGDFFPAHSHSGYLDTWLDLGLLGLSLLVAGFAVALIKALRVARLTTTTVALWPPIFLAFMLLSNVPESSILKPNDLWWALYVATVLSVAAENDRIAKLRALRDALRRGR